MVIIVTVFNRNMTGNGPIRLQYLDYVISNSNKYIYLPELLQNTHCIYLLLIINDLIEVAQLCISTVIPTNHF